MQKPPRLNAFFWLLSAGTLAAFIIGGLIMDLVRSPVNLWGLCLVLPGALAFTGLGYQGVRRLMYSPYGYTDQAGTTIAFLLAVTVFVTAAIALATSWFTVGILLAAGGYLFFLYAWMNRR